MKFYLEEKMDNLYISEDDLKNAVTNSNASQVFVETLYDEDEDMLEYILEADNSIFFNC